MDDCSDFNVLADARSDTRFTDCALLGLFTSFGKVVAAFAGVRIAEIYEPK